MNVTERPDDARPVRNAFLFDFELPFNARLAGIEFTVTDAEDSETIGFRFSERELQAEGEPSVVTLKARGGFFGSSISHDDLGNSAKISPIFDRLIWHLNNFLASYMVITKDTFVSFVSLHSVPLAVWHYLDVEKELRKRDLLQYAAEHIDEAEHGILTLGWMRATKGMTQMPPIDGPTLARVIHNAYPPERSANPFFNSELFYLLSRKYHEEANYAGAVVFLHSSVETFLSAFLILVGLDADLATRYPTVEAYLRANPFTAVVKRAFQNHIKGINWDFSAPSSQLRPYFDDGYELRNRVIHGGHYPQWDEAERASQAVDALRSTLIESIKSQHKAVYEQYLR